MRNYFSSLRPPPHARARVHPTIHLQITQRGGYAYLVLHSRSCFVSPYILTHPPTPPPLTHSLPNTHLPPSSSPFDSTTTLIYQPPQHNIAVHYQPGSAMGGAAGASVCLMFTSRALMLEVGKHSDYIITDGKNDTNSAGYILSVFSLRTGNGTPYPAFIWLGEHETEETIFNAGKVFSNLVPCGNPNCTHPWTTEVRADGGCTKSCPCSVNSNFSPGSSTDKFLG